MVKINRVISAFILIALFSTMFLQVMSFKGCGTTKGIYTLIPSATTALCPSLEINQSEECSAIIVTGSAAKDGRPILMKNRDSFEDRYNIPVYIPATASSFAFVAVNTNTMGINERGLAVMNTAMPDLEEEAGVGNLVLNRWILEKYESVDAVARDLNNSYSLIGPNYRSTTGTIATCIGVIDRFGEGAFFEISNTQAYAQYIVDGYDTRANHPRIFPGLARGPSGRDQYLLDALDEVYKKNGIITWTDVMQKAARCVRDKEFGLDSFSIDGEVCNPYTGASMVAVSGDTRYDGGLNIMWCAYGITPLVGVFVPSLVTAGHAPDVLESMSSYTHQKWLSAKTQSDPILLDPIRIQEIQHIAFYAEEYAIREYESFLNEISDDALDNQIEAYASEYIERVVGYVVDSYLQETTTLPMPTRTTISITITRDDTTSISSTSSTATTPGSLPSSNLHNNDMNTILLGTCIGAAIALVLVLIFRKHAL
jgi:hypothetical protein